MKVLQELRKLGMVSSYFFDGDVYKLVLEFETGCVNLEKSDNFLNKQNLKIIYAQLLSELTK